MDGEGAEKCTSADNADLIIDLLNEYKLAEAPKIFAVNGFGLQ